MGSKGNGKGKNGAGGAGKKTKDEAGQKKADPSPEEPRAASLAEARREEEGGEAAGDAKAGGDEGGGSAKPPTAEAESVPEEPIRGAAWAHPIARFERRWTWLESRLLTFVLVWQILALCAWVFLNGLSESITASAGAVFRAVILAVAAGGGAWFAARKQGEERRRNLTMAAMAAAIALVLVWRRSAVGGGAGLALDRSSVKYFDNVKGWLQEGSTLTLLGGLRGLGTRLTLWLALLGGSLATAAGKHIHVDVVFRFLPKKLRMPVSVMNYLVAAAVCFAAVWGFFDHIAIESYGSNADATPTAKIENALHHIGDHAFYTRKQIGLDVRSLPHVLAGQRYDEWMSAKAWNEWVDGAGFGERFGADKAANLHIPSGTHPPFVVSPVGETTRGALAQTLGLVFPFGLFAIALRFVIRALLTLSGHLAADPDEAHKEDVGQAAEGGA